MKIFFSKMSQTIRKYLIRPTQLALANPSVFALVLVVIGLDRLSSTISTSLKLDTRTFLENIVNGDWIYNDLPKILENAIDSRATIYALVAVSLLQSAVTIIVMTQLKLIYGGKRAKITEIYHAITLESFVWYFIYLISIYAFFGIIFLLSFLVCQYLWHLQKTNYILVLLVLTIIVFPYFYCFLSLGAKIAVLPVTWKERFVKIRQLLNLKSIIKIYIYYPIRLIVEFVTLFIIPLIALAVVHNSILALLIGLLVMSIPLSIFRASTFEFFLDLYSRDEVVKQVFSYTYQTDKKRYSQELDN